MKLFDEYIEKTARLLDTYMKEAEEVPLEGPLWPCAEKNPYIMERETSMELGGYPKESINLLISTSGELPVHGIHVIGSVSEMKGHASFGKIVLLQTEEIPDEDIYTYQQDVNVADVRLRMEDVMVRSSGQQYLLNLRVGKKAAEAGFDLGKFGRTAREHFMGLPRVKDTAVILLVKESPLYKELLPVAENVRQVASAVNTILEGLDMECGSCNLNEICTEVEGLRELHRAKQEKR